MRVRIKLLIGCRVHLCILLELGLGFSVRIVVSEMVRATVSYE